MAVQEQVIFIPLVGAFIGALITSLSYYLALAREYSRVLDSCAELAYRSRRALEKSYRDLSFDEIKALTSIDCAEIERRFLGSNRLFWVATGLAITFMVVGVFSGEYGLALLYVTLAVVTILYTVWEAHKDLIFSKEKLGNTRAVLSALDSCNSDSDKRQSKSQSNPS